MGGTGALWRPIAASLEAQFDIFAPDQRGHGRSRPHPPASYSATTYGADVIETWNTLSFSPSWVIAHSMGVRTACAAAHLAPQLVQGLVLIDLGLDGDSGGELGDELSAFIAKLPTQFESRALAREFIHGHCPDPSIGQYLLAVATPVQTASGTGVLFPFDRQALVQTIHEAKSSNLRPWIEQFAKLHKPILFLRGETSRVWSRNDFEAERSRFEKFPQLTFQEFEGTGHGLPFEKRSLFCETVQKWIYS